MLLLYSLVTLALSMAEQQALSYMEARAESEEMSCAVTTIAPQDFFPFVSFVRIDTTCLETFHPRADYLPLRVGVDTFGAVFRVFNFDTLDYDKLLKKYPLEISQEIAYDYGRFYLEMTYLHYPGFQYYISRIDTLKTLNREDTREWWEFPSEFEKQSKSIDKTIDSISAAIHRVPIVSMADSGGYVVLYYIWHMSNGALRSISLHVASDGRCSVIKDEMVAREVGYYEEVRWMGNIGKQE